MLRSAGVDTVVSGHPVLTLMIDLVTIGAGGGSVAYVAALGIIKVVNSNMALAIWSNSVARSLDPRHFSIMPFGGAGPLHGAAFAEADSARDVIVPVAPGIKAAVGLLKSDM